MTALDIADRAMRCGRLQVFSDMTREEIREAIAGNIREYTDKHSERTSETVGEVSPLIGMVSWLKQRKNEVDEKWTEVMGENGDAAETYQHLYESYTTVIGDIITHNKEAN